MKNKFDYEIPVYIYLIWISLAVSSLLSLINKDWVSFFISATTFLLTLYSIHLCKTSEVRIPPSLLTATIIFIYATLFLGEVSDFYEKFWWWDILVHSGSAVGFGLVGAIVLLLVTKKKQIIDKPLLVSLFAFSFAMSIGAVWEIFEFTIDSLFDTNMQKSGLPDTMFDLIVDAAGALVAASASYFYITKSKKDGLNKIIDEGVEENKKL